jgi:hypothetical protein
VSPFTQALLLSAACFALNAQTTAAPAAAATITVAASANPSTFASPVTFTVTVAAPASSAAVPTGTITATLLGPIFLGNGTLDRNGQATITVPGGPQLSLTTSAYGLPAGSDSITFAYSGDAKYTAAQSTVTQFVDKANSTTSTSIDGSAQPLHLSATVRIGAATAASSPFTLPGNLSSDDPTGTVQFFNGTTLLGTATLSPSGLFASTATLPSVTVPASLTAVYSGDNNYNGSTSIPNNQTGKFAPSLTVTPSVNPATFAQDVTFTVAITPAAATGAVTASLQGLFNLGSATLSAGQATITVPGASSSSIPWGLPAGSNSITFTYTGDANYLAASATSTEIVEKAATKTVATIPSATSIAATVSINEPSVTAMLFALPGANAAVPNPSGGVQFLNGSTVIGTAQLNSTGHFQATATLTVAQPFSSSAVLTAVYTGDSNYNGSTSPAATMPTLAAVAVGVASSANPSTFAEPVTFTVKVAPASANSSTPAGSVNATVGGQTLGSAALDSTGSASITVPPQNPNSASPVVPFGLATGSNAIAVAYSGDSNFAPGQSTITQMVTRSDTSTSVILPPVAIGVTSFPVTARVSIDEASVSKTIFLIPSGGNLSTSPTGSVSFFDGATLLGTSNLTAGALFQATATFTVSSVPSALRAVYYGDGNYNGSSSPSQSSGNGTASVTLASSNNPTVYGAAFAIQATVAPATAGGPVPTGTVQFFDGTQNLNGTATLDSSGHAALAIPIALATPLFCTTTGCPSLNGVVLPAGANVITAQYGGDSNYAAATSATPLTQQITKAPTSTAVTSVVGGNFTSTLSPPSVLELIATVADAPPPSGGPYRFMLPGGGNGDPTGVVTFYSGTTSVGTGSLAANGSGNVTSTATLSPTGLTTTTGFSATYPGDANFQASGSPVKPPPTVTLTSSPNPSATGQSVTLTATISSTTATPALTGTVTFLDGTTPIGNGTVSGGVATVTAAFTTAGSHSLTATYSGDPNYAPSTSPVDTQVVTGSTTPFDTVTLSTSNKTAVYGQNIVFLAQVTGSISAPPTGTVTFLDGATVIGSGVLSGGSAYLVTTLAVGTHQISAKWAGDANWPAAQSATVPVTVNRSNTHTALTSFGDVWTATVLPTLPGEGTPTGTVQFVDIVTKAVLSTVTLSNGTASMAMTSAANPLEAEYSGDANFAPSTSRVPTTIPLRPRM